MNLIKKAVDNVYEEWKKDKFKIIGEHDLQCVLYGELIKDKRFHILTEWTFNFKKNSLKKRNVADIVIFNEEDFKPTKNEINIEKCKAILELKAFWWFRSQKSICQEIKGNIDYLYDLRKYRKLSNHLYLICFDERREPLEDKALIKLSAYSKKKGVNFIYKYLNTRPS